MMIFKIGHRIPLAIFICSLWACNDGTGNDASYQDIAGSYHVVDFKINPQGCDEEGLMSENLEFTDARVQFSRIDLLDADLINIYGCQTTIDCDDKYELIETGSYFSTSEYFYSYLYQYIGDGYFGKTYSSGFSLQGDTCQDAAARTLLFKEMPDGTWQLTVKEKISDLPKNDEGYCSTQTIQEVESELACSQLTKLTLEAI